MTARPGFTLLEALVAMVIASTVLAGFYQAMGTAARTAGRLSAIADGAERRRNALELAETINPMKDPQGSLQLAAYTIAWTSDPIEDPRSGTGAEGGESLFRIGLYRLNLRITDARGGTPQVFSVDRVGWLRTGQPDAFRPQDGAPPDPGPGSGFHQH